MAGVLYAKVDGAWVPAMTGTGPPGPPGPSGIHIGPTPPTDNTILWADTTEDGLGTLRDEA